MKTSLRRRACKRSAKREKATSIPPTSRPATVFQTLSKKRLADIDCDELYGDDARKRYDYICQREWMNIEVAEAERLCGYEGNAMRFLRQEKDSYARKGRGEDLQSKCLKMSRIFRDITYSNTRRVIQNRVLAYTICFRKRISYYMYIYIFNMCVDTFEIVLAENKQKCQT